MKKFSLRGLGGMKRNMTVAFTQAIASLILGGLGIASFKLLNPEGMALFRHLYFTPFTISIGACAASHDYLRSLLFGQPPSEQRKAEMRSLIVVNSIGSLAILAIVFGMLAMEIDSPPILAGSAVTVAVFVFALRFVLLGRLEVLSRYTLAVIVANLSSLLPYIAVAIYWLASSQTSFFLGILVLNAMLAAVMLYTLNRFSPGVDWRSFLTSKPKFKFSFGKYIHIAMIALGTVLSYQGVEFLFYTITPYENTEVANYALAFTVAAVVRQFANTFLQPLQKKEIAATLIPIGGRQIPLTIVAELMIVAGLIVSSLILPPAFYLLFSKYPQAQILIPPLLFGVLGTSVFQLYMVQLIALSRVKFLAWSQMALAVLSLGAVWLLSDTLNLWQMSVLLSVLLWARGLVLTPIYARLHGLRTPPSLWLVRAAGSVILFTLVFT